MHNWPVNLNDFVKPKIVGITPNQPILQILKTKLQDSVESDFNLVSVSSDRYSDNDGSHKMRTTCAHNLLHTLTLLSCAGANGLVFPPLPHPRHPHRPRRNLIAPAPETRLGQMLRRRLRLWCEGVPQEPHKESELQSERVRKQGRDPPHHESRI